ncbi:MAG: YbjQ family protein [Firmicutes bacterium]|nr:YbjQ family protein [Bacillota bacterium]
MILSTVEYLPGKNYEILGVVKGCIVNTKHIGKDIGASLKTIVGGELRGYTEMLEEARQAADSRMIQAALNMGADAIIGIRYGTSSLMQGAAEIMVYGTAIKFTE